MIKEQFKGTYEIEAKKGKTVYTFRLSQKENETGSKGVEKYYIKDFYEKSSSGDGSRRPMKYLPDGYINKVMCGCGLTSLALESAENCVIAVPYRVLVANKVSQYNHPVELNDYLKYFGDVNPKLRCKKAYMGKVFGMFGVSERKKNGSMEKLLDTYLDEFKDGNLFKIVCTYDILGTVMDKLRKKGHFKDFRLVVDESHILFTSMPLKASSRHDLKDHDVCTKVLDIAKNHWKDSNKKVSFISATPFDQDVFTGDNWVKTLPLVEFSWGEGIDNDFKRIDWKVQHPKATLNKLVKTLKSSKKCKFAGTEEFSKIIVFLNDMQSIISVIEANNIAKESMVICGVEGKKVLWMNNHLKVRPTRYENLSRFTFVTSAGYNGMDLYDKDAMIVIVSRSSHDFTMVDPDYEINQAISRQRSRENMNYGRYILIYNEGDVSRMIQEFEDEVEVVNRKIELLNRLSQRTGDNDLQDFIRLSLESFRNSDNHFNQLVEKVDEQGIVSYELNTTVKAVMDKRLENLRKFYGKDSSERGCEAEGGSEKELIHNQLTCPLMKMPYSAILRRYKELVDDRKSIQELKKELDKNTREYLIWIETYHDKTKKYPTNQTKLKEWYADYARLDIFFKSHQVTPGKIVEDFGDAAMPLKKVSATLKKLFSSYRLEKENSRKESSAYVPGKTEKFLGYWGVEIQEDKHRDKQARFYRLVYTGKE